METIIYTSEEIIEKFLAIRNRTGSNTTQVYETCIRRFSEWIQKDLLDVKRNDVYNYIAHLENGELRLATKVSYLRMLRSFYEFTKDLLEGEEIAFFNPVPKNATNLFTPDNTLNIAEMKVKRESSFYTYEQLKQLLDLAYESDYEKYIVTVILTFSGCRVSEAITIKKENIDWKNRFFVTGTEPNARKSSKNTNGIVFCFSPQIAVILARYLAYHESKYGENQTWLFPSPYNNHKNHITDDAMNLWFMKLDVDFKIKSHSFRKSMSTYRRKMKCPVWIMETLSNHVITSVELKHYSQYSIEDRKRDYDEWYPTIYQRLEKMIPR
jgi:integrase